jgi:hypothetical protein
VLDLEAFPGSLSVHDLWQIDVVADIASEKLINLVQHSGIGHIKASLSWSGLSYSHGTQRW